MKIFSRNHYLCIKMLYKRVVLQKESNILQAIISDRATQKRRNGAKEKYLVQSAVFNGCKNQYR